MSNTPPAVPGTSGAARKSPLSPPSANDARGATATDWIARRKAAPLETLLQPTRRWTESLPEAIRPGMLLERFPRLANLVAASWKEPLSFRACLDDLLTDRRGGRQGLPLDVRDELEHLRRYYYFRECPPAAGAPATAPPSLPPAAASSVVRTRQQPR
jgi:hypothetical protein